MGNAPSTSAPSAAPAPNPPPSRPPKNPLERVFGPPRRDGPRRNPGWDDRVARTTAAGFFAGLAGGGALAAYRESIHYATIMANTSGNCAVVAGMFASGKEASRLVRQSDGDAIDAFVGGFAAGAVCASWWRDRRSFLAGGLALGSLCGGILWILDPASDASAAYRALGFAVDDGGWMAPTWFPVRRVSEMETLVTADEVAFQARVRKVIDGRASDAEARATREEYLARREMEALRRAGRRDDADAVARRVVSGAFCYHTGPHTIASAW
jgi:hypothetical protein